MRTTYRVELAYDGSAYAGFARQVDQPTVEGHLLDALRPLMNEIPSVDVGGRTDKGVHATGQVVSFWSRTPYTEGQITEALDKIPQDIVIRDVKIVPRSFHARYTAVGRRYSYFHPYCEVDIHLLGRMLHELIGYRDFSAFARNTPSSKSTLRRLWYTQARFAMFEGKPSIRIDFAGDGFLRKQVRVMVATAIREAQAKSASNCLVKMCQSRDRRQTAQPAPPEHLYLTKIIYPPVLERVRGLKKGREVSHA
ncbi:MAG: tRNA pseudouridine(38-40) synthase TruA [Myxococcota bacterium]|nr:tRNA pseudouridine(38-40) synthase TruA [Myxococcota bacterium]